MAIGPPLKHVAEAVDVDVHSDFCSHGWPQFGAAEAKAMMPARMSGMCMVFEVRMGDVVEGRGENRGN